MFSFSEMYNIKIWCVSYEANFFIFHGLCNVTLEAELNVSWMG